MAIPISTLTQLQAMQDDPTEDYELAANIEAAATEDWNGGLGFDPIGKTALNPFVETGNCTPTYTAQCGIAIWVEDDFIYACVNGYARKYNRSSLALVASSTENCNAYSNSIWADSTHVYFGIGEDEGGWQMRIKKFLKSDLSFIGETVNMVTSPLAVWGNDTYVFCAVTTAVRRYNKSTLVYVDSVATGGYYLWGDGTFLYAAATGVVDKINMSTMAVVDTSSGGTGSTTHIWGDDTYLFRVGDNGAVSYLDKYTLSDMEHVDGSDSFLSSTGGWIWTKSSHNYVYVCRKGTVRLWRFNKTTMAMDLESAIIGGTSHNVMCDPDDTLHAYVGFCNADTQIREYQIEVVERRWMGTFDGKGYTISNLHINRPDENYVGLFGYAVVGSFANVVLDSPSIVGKQYVGGLVGYLLAPAQAILSNIQVTGALIKTAYQGSAEVGILGAFLVCNSDDGRIVNCETEGQITFASPATYFNRAGGLACRIDGFEEVSDCLADAIIALGDGGYYAGAFCYYPNDTVLRRCAAFGQVSGGGYLGGFTAISDAEFYDCYVRASVVCAGSSVAAGGFISYAYSTSEFYRCYVAAAFTEADPDQSGGFAGMLDDETVLFSACFWDVDVSGMSNAIGDDSPGSDVGIVGKATADMKAVATFSGAGWQIGTRSVVFNDKYPYLAFQIEGLAGVWHIYSNSPRTTDPVEDKITLELVRNVEIAAGGSFYIDREGNARYESRFFRTGAS